MNAYLEAFSYPDCCVTQIVFSPTPVRHPQTYKSICVQQLTKDPQGFLFHSVTVDVIVRAAPRHPSSLLAIVAPVKKEEALCLPMQIGLAVDHKWNHLTIKPYDWSWEKQHRGTRNKQSSMVLGAAVLVALCNLF